MTATPAPRLSMRGITRSFGPVTVLHGIDLDIRPGEVHALLGENGAGKSTLMKILAGVQPPSSGEVLLNGQPVRFRSVAEASRSGVRMLFQELSLAPDLTVEENLFLGQMPATVTDRALREQARAHLASLNLDLPLGRPLRTLTVGERQMVAIARALIGDPQVLILDEPTAPLTSPEVELLFTFITQVRARGVAVVYISHHLAEVFRMADRVTVLRDGRQVATTDVQGTTPAQVIEWMVGRHVEVQSRVSAPQDAEAFHVQVQPRVGAPFELTLRRGEIVGLVGIIGSGRTAATRALIGADGHSRWNGRPVRSLRDARRAGIGVVPEDRKTEGAVLDGSIRENLALSSLDQVTRLGMIDRAAEDRLARQWMTDLHVRPQDPAYRVGSLSGGNQQKVVLGRVLATRPQVLVLEEPTRGVDIGAREEIYEVIARLAREGLPVVLSSSDSPEVLGLARRILIFRDGALAAELHAPVSLEEVTAHVTGASAV